MPPLTQAFNRNMEIEWKHIRNYLLLSMIGIAAGTLISSLYADLETNPSLIAQRILMIPISMTIGIAHSFRSVSIIVGALICLGLILWILSIPMLKQNTKKSYATAFIGMLLWSLGNLPVVSSFTV